MAKENLKIIIIIVVIRIINANSNSLKERKNSINLIGKKKFAQRVPRRLQSAFARGLEVVRSKGRRSRATGTTRCRRLSLDWPPQTRRAARTDRRTSPVWLGATSTRTELCRT